VRMSTLIIAIMGVTLAAVFALVVINRESREVVSAAVPVSLAAIGAIMLVFAYTRPAPISRTFPVVFVLEQATSYPVVIPDRPFPTQSLALFDSAIQANPKAFEGLRPRDMGDPTYHEYLQKLIVDWIAHKHFSVWRLRIDRFQYGSGSEEQWGPAPDASNYPSKKLSKEDVKQALGKNRFASVHNGFGTLAVPPGTTLTVSPEQGDIHEAEVRLKNRLVDLRVVTRPSSSGVGMSAYTMFSGLDPGTAQQQFWSRQFIVRITATFQRYLVGHPNMATYREWANGIVEGLAHDFDDEGLWKRTSENYMLRQHLPDPVRKLSIGIGPIRSLPPAQPKPSDETKPDPPSPQSVGQK
jgi:hypothetical protein